MVKSSAAYFVNTACHFVNCNLFPDHAIPARADCNFLLAVDLFWNSTNRIVL